MEIDESYWGNNRINCRINSIKLTKTNIKLPQIQLQTIKNTNNSNKNFITNTKQSNTIRLSNQVTMFAKVIPTFMLILNIVTYYLANASLMSLPDGIENILGFVPKSTFQCERDGYFGDIDNDCRIFHLCQKQVNQNGKTEWRHWTYACGNQTMFNQLTLTCAFVDEAIPCRHASQFQYLNEVIHKPKEPFLTDADVTSGISYYSNRIMSDGARTRAFRDSNLMAQLGGEAMLNSFASSNNINNFQPQQSQQIQRQQQPKQQQHPSFFFQPLQSHSTFNSERREAIVDTEDSSSRADNAIDTPDQSGSFQSTINQQARPQQQVAQPQFTNEFTINHQNQFQHQINSNQNLRPVLKELNQFTSESQANNNFGEPNGNRFFNAQPQPQQPQRHFQLQRQQQQPQARLQKPLPPTASSFDFSISTNHQLGSAPDSSVVTSNQFRPIQTEPQTSTVAVPSPFGPVTTTTENHQSDQPTSSPFNAAPTFARFPTTTLRSSNNNQQFLPASARTTTTVPPTTDQPLSTEPQVQTTTQGSLAPPTTSTAFTTTSITTTNQPTTTAISTTTPALPTTSATATTTVERQQQPRRRQTGETRSSRSQSSRQQQMENQNNLLFDQIHRPFQSTRLSAQRRQEPAVVMRRQTNQASTSQPLVEGSNSNSASSSSSSSSPSSSSSSSFRASLPLEESNSFWLRPFDMQFMAPRFESLLTRRRV